MNPGMVAARGERVKELSVSPPDPKSHLVLVYDGPTDTIFSVGCQHRRRVVPNRYILAKFSTVLILGFTRAIQQYQYTCAHNQGGFPILPMSDIVFDETTSSNKKFDIGYKG